MDSNSNALLQDTFVRDQLDDSISMLRFFPSKTNNILASGGWDCKIRAWNITCQQIQKNGLSNLVTECTSNQVYQNQYQVPILSVCWLGTTGKLLVGSADGEFSCVDIQQNQKNTIGKHDSGLKDIVYNSNYNVGFTGGWDGKLNVWDFRSNNPVLTYQFKNKIYTMSTVGNLLVVGLSERVMAYFNLQKLQNQQFSPEVLFESHLKYQTRRVCCFPEGNGFAEGSIEGRVAIKYVNLNVQPQLNEANCITTKEDFAFRCHRNNQTNPPLVYPVNDIAFNPVYGTFATVGGDGSYIFWDKDAKSRLRQGNTNDKAPITACDYSASGDIFAYSIGYDWSKGSIDSGKYQTKIGMRYLVDNEKKKKPK